MGTSTATVTSLREIASQVVEIDLAMVDPTEVHFRAGQYISLACGAGEDGRPARRAYSIGSSARRTGGLTLLIKLVTGPDASGPGTSFLGALRPGDQVTFTGPMGFFVLDPDHAGDVVFAATGTGLAPVLPMIEEELARPAHGRVTLYWGLRDERDLFYLDRLEAFARAPRFCARLCLTQPGAAWAGERGRIIPAVMAALPALSHPTFYLVGNGAMIHELRAALVAAGVDRKRQIRTEAYFSADAPHAKPAGG